MFKFADNIYPIDFAGWARMKSQILNDRPEAIT